MSLPVIKLRYIQRFISVSAPWGGTPKSVRDLLSGDSIIGDDWYNYLFDIFDRERVSDLVNNVFSHQK
jgi:hypothetical protein